MKRCPSCAEEIQDEAIKCRWCGEFLVAKPKGKWYTRTSTIFIGFIVLGPLVLPLVWAKPEYSRTKKIIVTALIILATIGLIKLAEIAVRQVSSQYQQLF